MKISNFANVFRLPGSNSIGAKKNDGEGGSGRNQYDPNQTRKDNQENESGKKQEFDQKKVDDAVEDFHADSSTQASGLSAVVEGFGPGLRIAVKDLNGTVVREFSSDEFIQLRDKTSKATGSRGKILDRKL